MSQLPQEIIFLILDSFYQDSTIDSKTENVALVSNSFLERRRFHLYKKVLRNDYNPRIVEGSTLFFCRLYHFECWKWPSIKSCKLCERPDDFTSTNMRIRNYVQ